jgi:hypothetical protein
MAPQPTPRSDQSASVPVNAQDPAAIERHRRRRDRELATVNVMIRMYCHDHHAGQPLCADCAALLSYATRRLERCVFGVVKPTCANCKVHCYSADMRARVKAVMRYAGPRMLLRHPVLGIAHIIDGRRPAPELPTKASNSAAARAK